MDEIVRVFDFEGKPLTAVTYDGKPAFIAAEVSDRLGYSEGGRVASLVRKDWKEEFEEGHDYILLRGRKLRDFKNLIEARTESVLTYTSHLMLLFESGVNVAALLSRKKMARRLRRFIAREVMPQIARDGRYLPERYVDEQGQLTSHQEQMEILNARTAAFDAERRLEETKLKVEDAGLKKRREDRLSRQTLSKGMREQAKYKLSLGHIDRNQFRVRMLFAAETLMGNCDSGDWLSYSDLSAELGVSASTVGQMVNEAARSLGMTGDELRSNTQYFRASKMSGRIADFVRGVATAEKKRRRGRKGKTHPDQIKLRSIK
jgi:prophage antirepressor-like protein